MSEIETQLKYHKIYDTLISPKGIQKIMLISKLNSMETYINEIMEKYTVYKIKMCYDTDEIDTLTTKNKTSPVSINILAINKKSVNGNYLVLERLSTFETLILTVAFKRALNRYTNRNKSNMFIMDESVECMDAFNFEKVLPNLMTLISEGYTTVLIISQRDINHISENTIKISKDNGVSRIV